MAPRSFVLIVVSDLFILLISLQ
ncbi:YjcZ family sporulation protein [Staphylococcus kloosii]|nr:YjcZ family sporulation protein [Staphylococcus kloosii]